MFFPFRFPLSSQFHNWFIAIGELDACGF